MKFSTLFILLLVAFAQVGQAQTFTSATQKEIEFMDSLLRKNMLNVQTQLEFASAFYKNQTKQTTYESYESIEIDTQFINLSVWSLVSPELYKNWDQYVESYKNKPSKHNLLIAVSEGDDPQRSDFVIQFHTLYNGLNAKEAYEKAVEYLQKKHKTIRIKHYFQKAQE